ncbi:hypothetical protein [Roseateles oligotrophus]|uniref:Lipoprotein n=1 Tax=Roseateles oligotrophus TaxID=1769250 RepID=A0ABT2Y9G2_9BURK|nr:hypothetical protein [Roseateles oligotrophus]MCV2366944.1 hypothetical protein [Roseateles oligotrophus]
MNFSFNYLASLLLAGASALTLSACGSGGDTPPEPPPEPKTAQINSANYGEAVGVAFAGFQRSQPLIESSLLPLTIGFTETLSGSYPCKDGGSLTLLAADKVRTFTAVDCKDDAAWIVSGTLTETISGANNSTRSYKLKDVNIQTGTSNQSVAVVNGAAEAVLKADGSTPESFQIDLSVALNGRTDTLGMSLDAAGKLQLVIDSTRFPQKLLFSADTQAKSFTISSKGDGSSMSVTPSADGKTFLIELRASAGGTPTFSKTASAEEFAAWLVKSL